MQDVEIAASKAREREADVNRVAAAGQVERIRQEEVRKNMEAKRENERALMDYKLHRER